LALDLVANPDLLAELGTKRRGARPVLVGFAAETHDVIANAQNKLAAKKCDLVVANDVSEPGSGFAVDTNHVTFVDHAGAEDVPPGPKSEIAHKLIDRIVAMLAASTDKPRRRR